MHMKNVTIALLNKFSSYFWANVPVRMIIKPITNEFMGHEGHIYRQKPSTYTE